MKDKELYYLRDEIKKSQEETLLITKESLTELVEENLKFRSIDFPFSIKESKESEVIYKALQMVGKICGSHISCATCLFYQRQAPDKLPCGITNISPAAWNFVDDCNAERIFKQKEKK